MVADHSKKHLYVVDKTTIWRVDFLEKPVTSLYRKHGLQSPVTLSLNEKAHRLVVSDESNTLRMYDLVLNTSISVELDSRFALARHALITNRSGPTYVVCCQYDDMRTVVEVDTEGKVLQSFHKGKVLITRDISDAYYAALDESNDHVFVIDRGNDRVLLLKPDLQLHSVLLRNRNGTKDVSRLCYDRVHNQLIVGTLDGTVNCYKLSLLRQV